MIMKEIEIKAYLKNKPAVLQKLAELGCEFSEPVIQTDTVFAKVVAPYANYLKNEYFIRIREKNDGTFLFTVKMQMGNELTKTEYETAIDNGNAMMQALMVMGYQQANRLKKTRQVGHYQNFEICIDHIEGLGEFIEVEKMSSEDENVVRIELEEFLFSLGVLKEHETKKGYDMLIMEQSA